MKINSKYRLNCKTELLLTLEADKQAAINVNLKKSKTEFIIPFLLKEDYQQIHERLVNSDWEVPKSKSRKNILENVKKLIQDNDSYGTGMIGREYILKTNPVRNMIFRLMHHINSTWYRIKVNTYSK